VNIVVYLKLERDYRAHARVDASTCEGCGICVSICPFHVPALDGDTAAISPDACRGCGVCAPLCKTQSIHMTYALNEASYSSPVSNPTGLRHLLDKQAIEAGLALRDEVGGEVRVLAEGSAHAEEALREALVMGVDECVLLCDPRFLGADEAASSLMIEAALKKLGAFDLLLAPQRAQHGESIYGIAWLAHRRDMAYMPFVRSIEAAGEHLLLRQRRGESLHEFSVALPAVLSVERGINEPRGLSLMAAARVMGKTVARWSAEDLDLNPTELGEAGSRIRLEGVEAPPRQKKKKKKGAGEMLKGSPEDLAGLLVERLKAWQIL